MYALPQFLELLTESLGNGLSVDGKNLFSPVRRSFQHLETCLFGLELSLVFLRVEFPCVFQRLSHDERCGLSVTEADKAAEVFGAEHFTEIGEPCRLCDFRFQERYFLLVLRFLVLSLTTVLPFYFPHLSAVVGLQGLYSGLQGFDGFPVRGYLPMQGGILPF